MQFELTESQAYYAYLAAVMARDNVIDTINNEPADSPELVQLQGELNLAEELVEVFKSAAT